MNSPQDTIVAIATPTGIGGIAVLRISGDAAISIIDQLFDHKRSLSEAKSHVVQIGPFYNKPHGEKLDEVVVTIFRKPNSYTGENVVEISCHGGQYISRAILEAIINHGAKLADPGEFTKRAFLNGKIDLAQAEAVADIIHAKTQLSAKSAMQQLQGEYSQSIANIQNSLINVATQLELEIDFSEEDIIPLPHHQILAQLENSIQIIDKVVRSYQVGRWLCDGIKTVIIGKPNVGKSSLFNALLGFERAIVDEMPGTTRDIIEMQINIGGALYYLFDTAGVRGQGGKIELKGIELTERKLQEADLILFVLDVSSGFLAEDKIVMAKVLSLREERQYEFRPKVVIIWNKCDLPHQEPKTTFPREWSVCHISAKKCSGLDQVHQFLVDFLDMNQQKFNDGEMILTNVRHKYIFETTLDHLEKARLGLEKGLSHEFIAFDVRAAINCIGEIVGKTVTEDILNNIFSHFCIGK